MPESTSEHLGFAQIWASIRPRSAPGRRAKAQARPFLPGMEQALERQYDRLEAVLKVWDEHPAAIREILRTLAALKDPFQAVDMLSNGQVLSPAELFILANLCACAHRIRDLQEQTGISRWPEDTVPPRLREAEALLSPGTRGQPRFYVSDGYSPDLAETRKKIRHLQALWQAQLESQAAAVEKALGHKLSGIHRAMGAGEIAIRKSDVELLQKARAIPYLGETRQTLTHVYFRFMPAQEVQEIEQHLLVLRARQREQEAQVLRDLSQQLKPYLPALGAACCALGELDFLLAKAELAKGLGATRPRIAASNRLVLEDAFHPEVKREVESRGGTYQPISIDLDSTVSVITGPNMGGKTVALSTVGLCVAMAQWGLMVPCKSMQFRLYDFIYFQPGEERTPGLSSFAAEIVSLKQPLSRMGQRGLVLLDEVGRGTNPSQGRALYAALLQYYLDRDRAGSTVVATTHYHGLAKILGVPHWQVRGLRTGEIPGSPGSDSGLDWLYSHMDYTLQRVGPDTPTPQDALVVAKALGLDDAIIRKALELYVQGE